MKIAGLKKNTRPIWASNVTSLIMLIIVAFLISPIMLLFGYSFSDNSTISTKSIPNIGDFSIENYQTLAMSEAIHSAIINSFVIGLWVAILSSIIIAPLVYSLVFRGKKVRRFFLKTSMVMYLIPVVVMIFPLVRILNTLSDVGSFTPIILAHLILVVPFCYLFLTISQRENTSNIYVAANLDGAPFFYQFFRIFIPNNINIVVSVFIFSFLISFSEFFYALVFNSSRNTTIPILVNSMLGSSFVNWGEIMAMYSLVLLLLFALIYFIMDKFFYARK